MSTWCKRLGLFGLWAALALAQTESGSIRVLVEDPSQSAIGGANVTVTNTGTGVAVQATTNEDGYAVFTPLVRGTYLVAAQRQGFQTVQVKDITLNVDERRLVRVALNVAQVSETVEVTANSAAIQTEQGSIGQVVTGEVAVQLPLAARRYTELALLTPGVAPSTLTPVTRGPGWLVANGNYHTQNNFLLDGVDNNQGTTNAQALSAQVVQPSPDSIAEFKVQTNSFSAEFGRSAGAVINVSIKSGTNEPHGSGWYYNRDASLAARPWRANLLNLPKPDLRWHQYGGTLGGPIVRNKLFAFGSYEGFRQEFSDLLLTTVPTQAFRNGVFPFDVLDPATCRPGATPTAAPVCDPFPNRTIPAARFDPLGKKLIDLFPEPNQPGRIVNGRPVDNYGGPRQGTENTHKFDTRTDYYLGERDSLMGRFSYLRQKFNREAILPGLADGVGNQGTQFNNNQSLGLTWTRTFSPTFVNVLRYGLNRTFAEFAHATAGEQTADEFGFRGFPAEMLQVGGLPLIDLNNYNDLGTRNFRPQFQRPWLNQVVNTSSWQAGAHSVRFGFEMRLKNNTFIDITRRNPAYSFPGRFTNDSVADVLLGLPEAVQLNTVPEVNQLQQAWSAFVQDDWKATRTLTLNLGLRYEYTTPYYGNGRNRNINFDPATYSDPATRGLATANDDDKYLITPDRNNFGPRLGVAWQAVPERVVVRGGYGVFYNGEDIYGSEANLPLNPPQLIQATLVRQGFGPAPVQLSAPLPEGVLSQYDSRNVSLRTREREQRSGLVQQWNLATQFQVGRDATFEVAYVGNRGRNLFGLYERNQTPFGVDGSVPANRPFPLWQGIQTGASRGRSWYNALQAKFERRFTAGWYSLVSYTYASALDEVGTWDAGNSPQLLDRFDLERGPMAQIPRQRLTAANVLELPFGRGRQFGTSWNRGVDAVLGGWQLSNILNWRTGLPVNVSLNSNGIDPRTGQRYLFLSRNGGALRPNRVGEGNTGIDPKDNRFQFLDANAYQVQPVNTPGNAARNSAWGPRFFTLDASLVKRFAVTEGKELDLRIEGFNVFNTVNFERPAATFGNTDFGQINNAFDPRVVQLAVRFRF